jgi:hypothetical protein
MTYDIGGVVDIVGTVGAVGTVGTAGVGVERGGGVIEGEEWEEWDETYDMNDMYAYDEVGVIRPYVTCITIIDLIIHHILHIHPITHNTYDAYYYDT